jgi:MFS transporter, DHA1 family, multidrug resistance protein
VGLVPALAGSAAAVAGLMQQLTGAMGGFLVGLVPHHGPVNLALLMMSWSLLGLAAQVVLYRFVLRH